MGNNSGAYNKNAIIGIIGILVFGTFTVLSLKFILEQSACPIYVAKIHSPIKPWEHGKCPKILKERFEKIWFKTIISLAATSVAIIPHFMKVCYNDKQAKQIAHQKARPFEIQNPTLKSYFYVIIPSMFDIFATILMTYGLVYIDVSIMQMLRGAMVVFCSVFSVWFLKRKIHRYQWVAVALTIVAVAIVGMSAILNSSDSKPWQHQLLGVFLVLSGTCLQAACVVTEDHMMEKYIAPPLFMLGMKSLWGFAFGVIVCLPLVSWVIPGDDNGHVEDIQDTFYMLADNYLIVVAVVVYGITLIFKNWAALVVTKETTSVVRSFFDVIRSTCIWAADLLIGEVIFKDSIYGERWSTFSWIQLMGFVLLIFSSQMYSGYVKYPFFRYSFYEIEKKQNSKENEPLLQGDEVTEYK
uniref:EamA-like transporter family protein n=1 Tax=Trepomonas sp. PC1 TaxID=1076344 RepID=A0A146K5B6_9EUKA|eukprot:JAP92110.1 EamA-like transporter family protein [Trepomonas sp. PC1]